MSGFGSSFAGASLDGFESQTEAIDGVRIHYVTGGDPEGKPVLLWHGFLSTWYGWRKVAPLLGERGYSVLIPDMPGYGDSDKPEGNAGYDGLSLARRFRGLVSKTGFGRGKKLTLIAHDMGAPAALLWAAHHPDEVASVLYLEEPVITSKTLAPEFTFSRETAKLGGLWWWLLAQATDAPERLILGHERAFLTWFYENYTHDRGRSIEEGAIDEVLRTFKGVEGIRGAFGVYRALFETMDQTEKLLEAKVKVPVIGFGGAGSQADGVCTALKEVTENVRGVTVTDCGHFIPEEQPSAIIEALTVLEKGQFT